jgi:glycerophosphoryl diester phosphodiesterase
MHVQASTASDQLSNKAKISQKIVIAHRGASGYLPEHSMAAKQLAFEMGAHYIEQDIVLSKDDKLLVLHDIYLDRVTDVAEIFPDRARADGRYYAIDFNFQEIATLRLTERFQVKNNQQVAQFPDRSPLWKGNYKIHQLKDEVELITKLNKQKNLEVGIYPEIKAPSFHRREGKDISLIVLKELKALGYSKKQHKLYLQSFDANELKRIDKILMPKLKMDLKLVQLIANTSWGLTKVYSAKGTTNYSYDWMFKATAMQKIADYAEGIGPYKRMLITMKSSKNKLIITPMLQRAHQAGLVVHPYTFRLDKGRVEKYADSFEHMLDIFYFELGVDGVFTDFPDRAVNFLKGKR